MGFWIALAAYGVSTALSRLFAPRRKQADIQPSSIGDFQLPTVEEGRVIPVVFGTCKLAGANVVWYGDLLATPILSGTDTVGYRYYLGIHYVLCQGPVDAILEVRFDDKAVLPLTITDLGALQRWGFSSRELYGPADREGGIAGNLDVYLGTTTQGTNDYLVSRLGSIPAYKGVCYAVARQMYLGNSAYIKPISFVVRRLPNTLGLTAGAHDVDGNANPAAMLYEILTNARWGLGLPTASVDAAAFQAAGQTLKTEGMGLSMVFDSAAGADELCQEILRHIDGVIYTDPTTGLLTLKLARADYSVPALPLLDPSNVASLQMTRPSWDQTRNLVRVRYVDRAANYSERVAQAQDLANLQVRAGEVASEDYDFRGFATAATGQRAAARVLKTVSYPLASFELVVNRNAWAMRPGDVMRLTWPKLGLEDLVIRITRIQPGSLADGKIRVEASEDIFAVTWDAYSPPTGTEWTDPLGTPQVLAAQRLVEAPFAMVGPTRKVVTLGARGGGVALGYQVWADPAGGTSYSLSADVASLTPSARLVGSLGYTATSVTVQDVIDAPALASISTQQLAGGENVLLLDDELIAWQTITDNGDGTYTLGNLVRGVMDTTPKTHASLARVWFATEGSGYATRFGYPTDLTLTAKFLPRNSVGVLPLGSATQISLTTTSRAARPYMPAAVKLNAASYPASISGELTVSWSHRNRLGEWLYDNAGATSTPEAGTTYRVKVYGESGTLIHTETGITGTSWTYLSATEIADSGLGRLNNQLRVVVESLVGATVSHQAYDYTVPRV